MKSSLTVFSCLAALAFISANGQTSPAAGRTSSTTTTTTAVHSPGTDATTTASSTEAVGTVSEFTPGASLVLASNGGTPVQYKLGKNVTYINAKGKEIKAERIRKDRKVRVHYTREGNDMVVDKVTIVRD
jgi:hypothetical protein